MAAPFVKVDRSNVVPTATEEDLVSSFLVAYDEAVSAGLAFQTDEEIDALREALSIAYDYIIVEGGYERP